MRSAVPCFRFGSLSSAALTGDAVAGMVRQPPPQDSPVRLLRIVYLLAGLGLLAIVVAGVDLDAVGQWLVRLGLLGIAGVVAVYAAAFLCDAASWWLILSSARLEAVWLGRLWQVRLVGEAFNAIVPAASLGGEPVKALLLKKRHGVDYREGVASLVMAKTTILLALIGFAAIGLVLMLRAEALADAYGAVAGAGLAALALGVVGFFAVQRWRIASRFGAWLARRGIGRRLESALTHLQTIDDRFVEVYRHRPGRFAGALGLAFGAWALGAVELYVILGFLGRPISLAEAWIIESVLQLVRAGSFFIPANLGASEIGFVVMVGALTGQPPLGLAAALVRRCREVLWISLGLLLGWRLSFTPAATAAEIAEVAEQDEP